MRYLKIFEEFVTTLNKKSVELSDTTIDDVFKPDFFEEKDQGSSIDSKGIIHIKNWNTY